MTGELTDSVLGWVLKSEGLLSDDLVDKGGLTNFGLTRQFLETVTARTWTDEQIRALTRETALSVYRLWLKMRRLDQLPEDFLLAWIVIDFAVHSGDRTAIRAVQKALGVVQDGIAGSETQGRWHLLTDVERRRVAHEVLADRFDLVGAWITHNPSQAKYAKGVMHRLSAQVRACA